MATVKNTKIKYEVNAKLKITRMDSLLDTIKALILNNYEVTVKAFYEEFPRETSIDYFEVSYKLKEDEDDD